MSEENSSGLIPVTDHELFQATTARGFEPGQTVFNRFVLTRVLGRGGMGIVWLAHDTQLEQDVAIKVLPDVVMHDREAVGDMKRETKRSLQLNHHNIVRIYDFNQDDRAAGISMEFVDGATLSGMKSERPGGCFDVADVAPWVEQICDALGYAHNTAKIVHRDLKPANIMLNKGNTIKVTDFGIARSISDSISRVSMRHASSGTMVYMSPQQSMGARSSASDDIYALGATIYDLLTGKPPFFSGNIQHQLENITPPTMAERRVEIDRHGHPIPEVWERVVASCLEKEPGRRPQTVIEVAQMLGLRTSAAGLTQTVVEVPAAPARHLPPPASVPPRAKAPLPPPQPEQPREPFFTPQRQMIAACVGGGVVLVALLVGLIAFFSRGSGSVSVITTPPGAMVTIGGKQMTSPATFDQVPSGDVTADISLSGYVTMDVPATVTKNNHIDLGMITLKRATGVIAVTVIPPQAACQLRLVQPDAADDAPGDAAVFSGAKVWQSPPLKTGKYELTTTVKGLPDGHDTIQIKNGDTQQIVVDLVKDDAAQGLQPAELTAVNSGDALPQNLINDPAAKGRLTDYYKKTFAGYLKIDQFDLAQSQIKRLADLGANSTDAQGQLDEARLVVEKGQGTVTVKTDPGNAAVTLDGQTLPSPATFAKVLAGTKSVQIKLQGYAAVTEPAQVSRDALTDLGTIELTRDSGTVVINVIPHDADATLKLEKPVATNEEARDIAEFSAATPYQGMGLVTGSYSVTATASSDGLPSATTNFDLTPGGNMKVTLDLVREAAKSALTPDELPIVEGDQPTPDAMKQDPAKKASLVAFYQQIFDGYLKLKEFKLAEAVSKHLSGDLGVASAQNEQELNQLQTVWLTTEKTNLNQLIQQERFTEADALLTDMESHGPQPDLRAAFTQAKAAHEDTVTKTLADIDAQQSAGNEEGALKAADAAAEKDKIEVRYQVKVATLESSMPSDFDRVNDRVKAMNAMLASEPDLSGNDDFNRLLGMFQKNLDKHNDLRGQMASIKKEIHSINSRIDSLSYDQKENKQKEGGYQMLNVLGAGALFGSLTQRGVGAGAGAGAGAAAAQMGANGANARDQDVRRDQAEIDDLDNQKEAKQAELDQVRQEDDALEKSPINAIQ